ncbi:MAG: efflux RND transporter periplasmic adaptor subunit [Vicingaceae bacterium]
MNPTSGIKLGYILFFTFLLWQCAGDAERQAEQAPSVTVVEVINKDVPIFQEFVGQVSGLYDIPIRARVDGFLEGRFFIEGNPVIKGQLLYEIDAQSYLAQVANRKGEVAEARTRLVNAQNELNRIRPLAEINAISKSDLDAATADEGAAQANLDAALAKLDLAIIELGYTEIKSPLNGIIGKSIAKRGEYVGKYPNPVILSTVSRIDTILVQFFITESDYLKVARDLIARSGKIIGNQEDKAPNVELILADGTLFEAKGKVDFIDREVDPTTGSILVQASFPNKDGLIRPGQYAKVRIQTTIMNQAKLIPLRAIIENQGNVNVFVVNDSSKVELREIQLGGTYGDLLLVTSGLEHNERIVLDGIQKIKGGIPVTAELTTFESKSTNPF